MSKFLSSFFIIQLSLVISAHAASSFRDSTTFKLGVIEIIGNNTGALLPVPTSSLTLSEINIQNKKDIGEALNLLPGVNLLAGGPRNESSIYLHGFDLRQVPLYIDGIPISVPYDGMVDLARFAISNASVLTINKGIASLLYGTNALGGSINIITRKPVQPLEYTAEAQYYYQNSYKTDAFIGANFGYFYLLSSMYAFHQDFYTLSKNFHSVPLQEGFRRENSQILDQDFSLRLGYNPSENEEFALTFVRQHSIKGNPTYIGNDIRNKPRFWRWPYWNKTSIYLSSTIPLSILGFSPSTIMKINGYVDSYKNALYSYDDSTYSTQNSRQAFQSFYDDVAVGSSISVHTIPLQDNLLRLAIQLKSDIHHENNNSEPIRTFNDITTSVEIEDQHTCFSDLVLFGGLSANYISALEAQNYDSQSNLISNFPKGSNFALNFQVGLQYSLTSDRTFSFAIANKTRFPTMKDRYSYRLGQALPDPSLKPERTWNFDITYTDVLLDKIHLSIDGFFSDIYDVIQRVDYVSGSLYQLQNTGHANQYGSDVDAKISMSPIVVLNFSYSYLRRVQISNPSLFFTDTPEHKFECSCNYIILNDLQIFVSGLYNSKRYSTTDGLFSSDSFIVFDFQSEYSFSKNFFLRVGIKNLLDENYAFYEGYPQPGRNFSIGISLR